MSRRLGGIVAIILLATVSVAAQDSRTVPVDDLKMVSGEWKGTLAGVRGGQVPYTLTIYADGSWKGDSPNGSTNGTMRVDGGMIRFQSATTGRGGAYTLHEEGGIRILRMRGDGGVSAELRRP